MAGLCRTRQVLGSQPGEAVPPSFTDSLYRVRKVPGSQVGEAVTPFSVTVLLRAREIPVSQAGKVMMPFFHGWSPQCQTVMGVVDQ